MRSYFWRIAAVVAIGFALLVSLSVWLGGVLPASASFIVQNPCPLSCVYGITPGATNRDKAIVVIQQIAGENYTYSPVNETALFFRVESRSGPILGLLSFNLPSNTLVRAAGFSPFEAEDDLGLLGDLMAAGLQPARVYRSCETMIPRMLIAFGENSQVIAEFRLSSHLRPDTPLTYLWVSMSNTTTLTEALTSFGCAVETSWRGFAPRWVYLSVS